MFRVSHRLNPRLKTVHPDPEWKGVPLDKKGRFANLHEPFITSIWRLLKWQLSGNPQQKEKRADKRRLSSLFCKNLFEPGEDTIAWLGHASFLIRIAGKTMLTDPIFFESMFLKRHVQLPFNPEMIRGVDYILLSHDHRDHCDEKTLRYIAEKCPQVEILTGLEMPSLLRKWIPDTAMQEAGWYQKYRLNEGFEIIFVPSRHWAKRGLFDERVRLWGGFFIKYNNISVYFMGDSGYGKHFEEIREICGEPDYAIMGIGAFKPEWFMHTAHISPKDAIRASRDLKAGSFIPMHYGTFDLSDERLLEPLDLLKEGRPDNLLVLNVGEDIKLANPLNVTS